MAQIAQQTQSSITKRFSAGSISATIWSNEKYVNGQQVTLHSISLQRSYKDKDGSWKNSANMRFADLPKAQLVLDKAYEFLALNETQEQTA
ncbi:MAG: hypothetical protein ACMXYA_00625 [Candidatus Woesearchaeota archaeon]